MIYLRGLAHTQTTDRSRDHRNIEVRVTKQLIMDQSAGGIITRIFGKARIDGIGEA